jgi:hypothetical protein
MVLLLLLLVSGAVSSHLRPRSAPARCGGYPFCASAAQQTRHDGWGWNGAASCIVRGSAAMREKCPSAPAASPAIPAAPAPAAAADACDPSALSGLSCGSYPVCNCASSQTDGAGWGWELQASCIVRGSDAASQKCPSGAVDGPPAGSSPDASGCSALPCPSGMSCGCYVIPQLGARKQQVFNAGGVAFLASAMMETNSLRVNEYPQCDGKSGLACNAGIAKQNFGNSRPCSRFTSVDSFLSTLNSDLNADAQTYKSCFAHYGMRVFMAGHRNGATGLANPDTPDINGFIAGFQWTMANLQVGDNAGNDVRFWVQIQAI